MIYIIKCNEFIKIGISKNPKKRCDQIQTGSPYLCQIIATKEGFRTSQDEYNFEDSLHKKYNYANVRGEWFLIGNKEIDNLIDCNEFKRNTIADIENPIMNQIERLHKRIRTLKNQRKCINPSNEIYTTTQDTKKIINWHGMSEVFTGRGGNIRHDNFKNYRGGVLCEFLNVVDSYISWLKC